jgi:ribonuclease PH
MVAIIRNQPRTIKITPNINPYAHGSVIVEFGNTKIHVTATVEESVPSFLKGAGKGWVTGEYAMLPGATHTRSRRDREKVSGRTQEIQRLIGRSLRAVVDTKLLGERSITLDCDVLVADGGTRTASISGAYVAMALAVRRLLKEGKISQNPLIAKVAALSVGLNKEGAVIADLNYEEDSQCGTDMNIVMNDRGNFIELQGTAEHLPFSHEQLMVMLETAKGALQPVFRAQDEALR